MTLRSQLQGFFMGAALVGGISLYQLQKDVWSSHRAIMGTVCDYKRPSSDSDTAFLGGSALI